MSISTARSVPARRQPSPAPAARRIFRSPPPNARFAARCCCRTGEDGRGGRAAVGLHDDRDRPAEAVQLRVGRPLRHGRRADGHGLHSLGRHLLAGRVWYAIGGAKGERPHLLGVGERTVCLAQADDWLNTHETDESAFKTRSWLRQPPTESSCNTCRPSAAMTSA